jgi:hypothetical protein
MRETRRVSDRTQTPEAPEPERRPAVALDPAPAMAPVAPIGGIALGQLGSVDAVIALQQASGNQAVDRVMRGRADAGEALTGALGAALAGTRSAAKPAAPKPATTPERRSADAIGSLLRNAAAGRPPPGARAARSQSPFAVDAGAVAATAGSGFGGLAGAGFVGLAGLESAVASFGGPAAAMAGHRVAADGGGADPEEGSGSGTTRAVCVSSGPNGGGGDGGPVDDNEVDSTAPGDDDAGDDADADAVGGAAETDSGAPPDPGDAPPRIRLRARLLEGERIAVDGNVAGRSPEATGRRNSDSGASGWVDLDAGRAAHEATRASWVRRQGGQAPDPPRGEQPPAVPSVDDPGQRRRRVDVFRAMAGPGLAPTAGPDRSLLLVADAIGDELAARARNDATRAQLLAWQGQASET